MSDPYVKPDPIDEAYVQAETLLSDEAARAARRARVLGALAREPVTGPVAPVRRPLWRRGGWLVAASVAGLGLLLATQVNRPFFPHQQQTAPAASTAAATAIRGVATRTRPSAPARPEAPVRAVPVEIPVYQPPTPAEQPATPPAPPPATPAPSPPPVEIVPETLGGPAQAAAPPAPAGASQPQSVAAARDNEATVSETVVVAEKRQARHTSAPVAVSAYTSSSRDLVDSGASSDPAARLRAAAAAGRTSDLKALLNDNVPADAPDDAGDTALMKAIQADQPAAAALLRRQGASLDLRNHAGESARDMATAKGDPALNQAIGLDQ